MKIKHIFYTAAMTVLLLATGAALAQDNRSFPVPPANPNQLFYLQRTSNTNTIVCELNYKNGQVDSDNPIHVYWIRYGEKGQQAELSFIQRSFGYGIKTKLLSKDSYCCISYLIKKTDVFTKISKQSILCLYGHQQQAGDTEADLH